MTLVKYLLHVSGRICSAICFFSVISVPVGFLLLPIHQKPPDQITYFERTLVGSNKEAYPLVKNHDYVNFAIYLMRESIPGAIGAGLALSGGDIAKARKKSKNGTDKFG